MNKLGWLTVIFLAFSCSATVSTVQKTKEFKLPSSTELAVVGAKIFKNETGGNPDFLVHWNNGEAFPSLGIGHFIWYPQGYNGPFDESFPKLIAFYQEQGVVVPSIFTKTVYAPWFSQEEFLKLRSEGQFDDLKRFFLDTQEVQIAFIFKRLQAALPLMMAASKHPKQVEEQFYRIASSPQGLYPLIDYVNFKGEGIKESERYQAEGWGLLQVLEGMKGKAVGQEALNDFSKSAIGVLTSRVRNAPPERGEERWLPGWTTRCLTYISS